MKSPLLDISNIYSSKIIFPQTKLFMEFKYTKKKKKREREKLIQGLRSRIKGLLQDPVSWRPGKEETHSRFKIRQPGAHKAGPRPLEEVQGPSHGASLPPRMDRWSRR